MSFVHLHLHSQYSLLEATCEFGSLFEKAKAMGIPALALTDYGNMFGAVEFYFAAQKAGVKPILGLEVYLAPKGRHVRGEDQEGARLPNRRLVLLAQNLNGYRNLCRISSIGYQEGFYYRPRVDDEVIEKYNEDLIAITGGLMGDIPWRLKNWGEEKAAAQIEYYRELFGDRFYLELCRTGLKEWDEINPFLIREGKRLGVKCVAANDVHFLEPADQVAQEVLICIGSNRTLQDPGRYRLGTDQFYLKSPEQMRELFNDIPEACDNTLEVAERCNVKFVLKTDEGKPIYHLPSFPTNNGRDLKEEIAELSRAGLERRFAEMEARGEGVAEDIKPKYFERLAYELKVIDQMGFNGYFLIVQDFINWAKEQGIPVGPGRGSGAGSIVAYSLGVTDLDPLPYNLIFERFLNPERISMPDFDVDFCQENRGRVINYVTQKYGSDSVSQIITYGKLQAKAAIRDVGRVLGMTYADVDVVAKLIPEKLGITLKEAIEMEPRLREMMEDQPRVGTLMELAQKIEGLTRHAGIHAAGVIIADGRIVDHAPLYRGADGENVVQYDMKHAEKIGLIKFDFLGLKTLTHIQHALDLIKKNRGKTITTKDISLKDPGIYAIMCRGDTAGIFQFESEGITDLIRKAQPNCFEDIVAINALYRPGPMDMIPDYLDRKHGRKKVQYAFQELEDVLKETYGVIVYQEQVQLIAARIASYSLGEADVLRRAMGKKIASEMATQKSRFLDGASRNGYDIGRAEDLFDTMAKFAEYGFNKSHAAAYCVVAAQTAFLKNYYPVEFYAALLSTEMSDTDKIVKYVKDARRRGIEVKPPHISRSAYRFTVGGEDIYFSLGAIKGVGESAVEAIIEAREAAGGSFASLNDFFRIVDLRRVNKKTIECLIKAGAMDGFGFNRAELLAGYSRFIDHADKKKKDDEIGQVSLFGLSEEVEEHDQIKLDPMEDWGRSTRLHYEKEVLGFYLSGHPLDGYGDLFKPFVTAKMGELENIPQKAKIAVVGLVSTLKEIITKKGTRMAFAQIEDTSGQMEAIIFPDVYAQFEGLFKSDTVLVVTGTLERGDKGEGEVQTDGRKEYKILVEKAQAAETLLRQSRRLVLTIDGDNASAEALSGKLALLKEILQKNPGPMTCVLELHLASLGKVVNMEISEGKGLDPRPEVLERISQVLDHPQWLVQ